MPLRNLTIICITAVLSFACYLKAERNRYAGTVAEAMHKVRMFYIEEVESRELFEHAMLGMVQGLDPYSAYIGTDEFRRIEEDLDQQFGGVGIEVSKVDDQAPLVVLTPLVDTPAQRAGLRPGDRILEVDGASTIGMSRGDAVTRMRGKPGSPVALRVQHADEDEPFDVTIVREVIPVQSVLGDTRNPDGSWDFHLEENPRIAYLRVTTFGKRTVEELAGILDQSQSRPFEAVILDLRGNAGGLLNAAVETCDLFVDRGMIVSTRGRDGEDHARYAATSELAVPKTLPLAVMVDGDSASASEIVAACLQDHKRAVVVGVRTYGKGTVQNIFELEGGRSALKLTTASYWRPSGQNIHRRRDEGEDEAWGVRPSPGFSVALTQEQQKLVFVQRRRRDVIHGLKHSPLAIADLFNLQEGQAGDEGEQNSLQEIEAAIEEPFDDPQLRKAIEYLEGKLLRIDAESRTA